MTCFRFASSRAFAHQIMIILISCKQPIPNHVTRVFCELHPNTCGEMACKLQNSKCKSIMSIVVTAMNSVTQCNNTQEVGLMIFAKHLTNYHNKLTELMLVLLATINLMFTMIDFSDNSQQLSCYKHVPEK